VRPYLELGHVAGPLELSIGGDFLYQDFGLQLEADEVFPVTADSGLTVGGWAAAEWEVGRAVINPSVRIDHYHYRYDDLEPSRETSVDPRLSALYHLTPRLDVKAAAGRYSGPSRFSFVEPPLVFGPVPAFEGPGLFRGLSHTYQYQAGIEARLPADLELVLTGFRHDSFAPVDFSLIGKSLEPDPTPCDGSTAGPTDPFDVDGQSIGAELLLRRRLGGAVYGWASYAISRAQRTVAGQTLPFDFDQRHVFNGVVSWEVGRNWTLGGVLHINTGSPYTPLIVDACPGGYFEGRRGEPNAARLPTYWRLDVRIQKREVFDTWFFDFYIDFFNAAFQFETIGYEVDSITGQIDPVNVPLFVPMIGIRGEF
jgi:hypothetical protein